MIAHIIVAVILIAIGIILLSLLFNRLNAPDCFCPLGLCAIIIGFFLGIWAPITKIDYVEFNAKYEIQQQMYENFEPEDRDKFTYIMDYLEINSELAKLQASKRVWDWWSCLPDEVLDLEPIGFGNN